MKSRVFSWRVFHPNHIDQITRHYDNRASGRNLNAAPRWNMAPGYAHLKVGRDPDTP